MSGNKTFTLGIDGLKMQTFSLSANWTILFLAVDEDKVLEDVSIESHKTKEIGRLKNLNRVGFFKKSNIDKLDLVELFSNALKAKNWDLESAPNPIAIVALYKEPEEPLPMFKKGGVICGNGEEEYIIRKNQKS